MSLSAITSPVLLCLGLLVLLGLSGFAVISHGERERRAVAVALLVAVGGSAPFFVTAFAPAAVRVCVLAAVAALGLAAGLLWFLPIGGSRTGQGRPARRVDERDVMFARARLKPGSPQYETYYAMRPDNREQDDRTRSLPGLLSPDAAKADPVQFAAAHASFAMTEALRDEVDGAVAPRQVALSASEMTVIVKRAALQFGAREVGITQLQPYHVYTHVGRGTGNWGEPIVLDHRWAIAVAVEMDHAVMRLAPEAPVVAESARQYVESAKIGIAVASMIRALGYPARAHIDGNYRVIAPLVARDAGLGEIGRMGILMTPRLGPRVRLAVVTTDVPLMPDPPGDDLSVIDFCFACRKCSDNCPSGSIPSGEPEPIDGGYRWSINPDSCFRYWNVIGTDCGRCMTVCPYSHPDSVAHNLVRGAVRRSGAARRGVLWLDDLFYGRRPAQGD